MIKQLTAPAALVALSAILAGCSTGNAALNPGAVKPQTFQQIELLSRPAVKELFEKFVDHQVTNAAEPYNDPTLQGEIQTFTDALRPPSAGKSSDYGKALASILYPNEYAVDLSQSGKAIRSALSASNPRTMKRTRA